MQAARNGTRKKGGTYLRQERVVRYRFITGEKACYPVRMLCRVMRESESASHAYASGKSYALSPHKAVLAAQVKEIFCLHPRRYGARRIAAQLKAEGHRAGRCIVRTLMRRGLFVKPTTSVDSCCRRQQR